MAVAPTLLGTHSVVREWGRAQWAPGGYSRRLSPETFGTQTEALRHAWRLVQRKLKRGYRSKQAALGVLEEEVERAQR